MIVYVRAKKDKDATVHVFEKFYGYVPEIRTLGGVRGDALVERIENIPTEDFTLVLLGREDRKWIGDDLSTAWMKVEFFEKAKVRNGRQHQIYWLIERAKNRFITDVMWKDTYILGKRGFITPKPGTDLFLAFWEEYRRILTTIFQKSVGTPLVVHRRNTDTFLAGERVFGALNRETLEIEDRDVPPTDVDIHNFIRTNEDYIREKTEVTKNNIRKMVGDRDVILPFSGGKDSLTVYHLLKETGVEFVPVFINTGAEFEETLRIAEKVGAEIVDAPIARKYRELGEEYLRRRACTRDKISSLYAYIREHFENPVIVNGDRIAESRQRSLRPDVRKDIFPIYSPIKYWGYIDEQLLMLTRGFDMNRLYKLGFYRIGCKFCPFMDKFEHWIISNLS